MSRLRAAVGALGSQAAGVLRRATRRAGLSDPGAAPAPTRLWPLQAAPDPQRGGRIVDADGREVLLRGVNVTALVAYWQGSSFAPSCPLGPDDVATMAGIGWNAVRLALSWSRIEPRPGRYDDGYLTGAARLVESFGAQGLYTILDLHQDAWGAALAARPLEPCLPPLHPALSWDGAPAWATLEGLRPRCYHERREDSPAVRAAWGAFFADAAGPGGVGIQTRYVAMLRALARRFARADAVAGFDVLNEPNAAADQIAPLSAFYARALAAVRAGERAGGGHAHLVLCEPSVLVPAHAAPLTLPRERNVVYAPHIYGGAFDGQPITRAAFQGAWDTARRLGGAPLLAGEWGTDPRRATDPQDPYVVQHQALQDAFRMGALLWVWRESCGAPQHVPDLRAGRVPQVWGLFDVDCRTNGVRGLRTALHRQLTRGYVRAAPGRLTYLSYDEAGGTLDVAGQAPRTAGDLVVFYPLAKHSGMRVQAQGLRAVRMMPAPAGGRYVTATPQGGPWSVHVRPR